MHSGNLFPNRSIVKANIGQRCKQASNHNIPSFLGCQRIANGCPCQTNQRPSQFILQLGCLGCFSANATAARTSGTSCGLFALITKHLLFHFDSSIFIYGFQLFLFYAFRLPSVERITTSQGISAPLAVNARCTACTSPPQQGTSIRTTVMLRMEQVAKISVNFSA